MKKIYAINFREVEQERTFLSQFSLSAQEENIVVEELASEHLMFLSGAARADTRVFYKNNELLVSPGETSFFFRRRTGSPATVALLANLLVLRKITFNGYANTFHTALTNKSFQSILLSEQGHRFPQTLVGYAKELSDNTTLIENNFSYPFILKSAGSKGQAVSKITTKDELLQALGLFDSTADVLISIQEFIENDFDMRALIFNGEYIGCYARVRGDHDFLNNLAYGGVLKEIKLTENEKEACCAVAEASPADFVGIDLIRVQDTHYFLELNRSPEIYPFLKFEDPVNIGKKLYDLFRKKTLEN